MIAVRTKNLYSFLNSKPVTFNQVTSIFAWLGCCWYGDERSCFLKQDALIKSVPAFRTKLSLE
jgi:hypothetical protein